MRPKGWGGGRGGAQRLPHSPCTSPLCVCLSPGGCQGPQGWGYIQPVSHCRPSQGLEQKEGWGGEGGSRGKTEARRRADREEWKGREGKGLTERWAGKEGGLGWLPATPAL